MHVEGRGDYVGDPGDGRDGAGNEAEEARVLVADAVGEDLRCGFEG